MYKKNIIILGSSACYLSSLTNFLTNQKLILIDENIYFLENVKNVSWFPIKNIKNEFEIFSCILNKHVKLIDAIIINLYEPMSTEPIEKINNSKWNNNITKHINDFFLILKYLLPLVQKSYNAKLIIILHKNAYNIKAYWSITESVNNVFITFLKCLNEEYKNITNIKINFVSTENISDLYKKNIYPYKSKKKPVTALYEACLYLINNDIKNMIIKI